MACIRRKNGGETSCRCGEHGYIHRTYRGDYGLHLAHAQSFMTLVYEMDSWPKLRWNEQRLLQPLVNVRHRQGRLIGHMQGLGFSLRREAELQTLTQEVVKSSEIEGQVLDSQQVRSSIARRLGIDIGALTPAD